MTCIRSALLAMAACLCCFVGTFGLAAEPISADRAKKAEDGTLWYDIKLLGLEGQGWSDVAAPFDRLPTKAQGKVRDAVWNLSRQSAGLCVRFRTDSPKLEARWELTSTNLAMPHMPATGVSGLDLYVRDDQGRWRWAANGRPTGKTNTAALVTGLERKPRDYLLYLPLYNGVSSVEIGLPSDVKLRPAEAYPAAQQQPIVFYGTSITQGGCASRPGMVHTAILGRSLNYPVINLGFSGNGQMEAEVGELIAEIDAAVYVIDCLPNLGPAQVKERTEPLVKLLRAKHPDTPILLVEDRTYSDAFLNRGKRQRNDDSRAELKAAYQRLQSAGAKELYYLEGEQLLGDDNEGTVDSSHPTDLGFFRQAEAFEAALRPILKAAAK
jgi:hypothetical protein